MMLFQALGCCLLIKGKGCRAVERILRLYSDRPLLPLAMQYQGYAGEYARSFRGRGNTASPIQCSSIQASVDIGPWCRGDPAQVGCSDSDLSDAAHGGRALSGLPWDRHRGRPWWPDPGLRQSPPL